MERSPEHDAIYLLGFLSGFVSGMAVTGLVLVVAGFIR